MNSPADKSDGDPGPSCSAPYHQSRVERLRQRIKELEAEKQVVEQELRQLQDPPSSGMPVSTQARSVPPALQPTEKIALSLDLFGARRSVYPKFWENAKTGKKGYTLIERPDVGLRRIVRVRRSFFHLPVVQGSRPAIHEVWEALATDVARIEQIAGDIAAVVEEARCPLVLSDRTAHLDRIADAFRRTVGERDVAVFRFSSGDGFKRHRTARAEIEQRILDGRRYVLFSTSALIGEGFDLPRLDMSTSGTSPPCAT